METNLSSARITSHFTLHEFVDSVTADKLGIANIPSFQDVLNLSALCYFILEPFRVFYQAPILVTSGYRCPVLNKAVGGVSTSAHLTGNAADICPVRTDLDSFSEFVSLLKVHLKNRDFDQMIVYNKSKFVHISYFHFGRSNRKEVLWYDK